RPIDCGSQGPDHGHRRYCRRPRQYERVVPGHHRDVRRDSCKRSGQSCPEGARDRGVYMAGGVALHVLDALQKPRFMETFTRKGRFKDLMGKSPIRVITARAALLGAATYGLDTLAAIKNN